MFLSTKFHHYLFLVLFGRKPSGIPEVCNYHSIYLSVRQDNEIINLNQVNMSTHMPPVMWRSCSWRPFHPIWPHRRTSCYGYRVWRHWALDEMSLVEFSIPLSQRGSRCYWCTCSRQCRPLWRSQWDRWCLQRAELWTMSWTQASPFVQHWIRHLYDDSVNYIKYSNNNIN